MTAESDRQRWDERYRTRAPGLRPPHPYLLRIVHQLPTSGRALDLAGGDGRHAILLASRGLDVTLTDISPVGLERARAAAAEVGVSITTVTADLTTAPPPAGPWDLIVCVLYFERALLARISGILAPGGRFVFVQPTRTNLSKHNHAARFVVEPGEITRLLPGLRILRNDEGWDERGQHEARIVATRDS